MKNNRAEKTRVHKQSTLQKTSEEGITGIENRKSKI